MLSRDQQILLKRAQAEARIDDAEYRETLESLTHFPGCRSSKDPRLTDEHMDMFLSYFEAIFWKGVDDGRLQPSFKANAVFRQRGFWAQKNTKGNTSRDRYTEETLQAQVSDLEQQLNALGYGFKSCQAYKTATSDPDFWTSPQLQEALKKQVAKSIADLSAKPFQNG